MDKLILTRMQLYDLVWTESLLSLSKKFQISDVGLRKICKKMNIPLPDAGHWNKHKAGKPVSIKPLPSTNNPEREIHLFYRSGEKGNVSFGESPLRRLQKEIESDPGLILNVPAELTSPENLITAARKTLLRQRPGKYGNLAGLVYCFVGELDIKVSPGNINRALCFMDTFIKILKARGHKILLERETFVLIDQEKMKINLREKVNVSSLEPNEKNQTVCPSDVLSFRVKESAYQIKEWKDGKLLLEKQLSKIIAWLELKAKEIKEERIRINKYWEEKRKEEMVQIEHLRRQQKELNDFKALLKKAYRWQRVKLLRDYLDELYQKASSEMKLTSELSEWILWAHKKVNWYDPWLDEEDELLKRVDKETLTFPT